MKVSTPFISKCIELSVRFVKIICPYAHLRSHHPLPSRSETDSKPPLRGQPGARGGRPSAVSDCTQGASARSGALRARARITWLIIHMARAPVVRAAPRGKWANLICPCPLTRAASRALRRASQGRVAGRGMGRMGRHLRQKSFQVTLTTL